MFLTALLQLRLTKRAYSPNPVEINRGLRFLEIVCSIVDQHKNIDTHGKRSSVVIHSRPITTDAPVKGLCISFDVRGNNNSKSFGSVIL